jgi:GR25 family glycosyltransferase involved in LPS biosynthesis
MGGDSLKPDPFKIPTYVINMKERPDRWRLFLEELGATAGALKIHRVVGQNGKLLDPLKDRRISTQTRLNILRNDRRTHREIATLGAIGCSISHGIAWRRFLASGAPWAMIMEDDARPDMAALAAARVAAPSLPADAKIWLLGYYKPNLVYEPAPESPWSTAYQFTASHAYMISREAAKTLLEQLYPIESHVDHYISAMSVLYGLKMVVHDAVYAPFGGLLEKKGSPRAIESNTSQHRKDGCSACHVPDHLSRFYQRVGPKTRCGRPVRGLKLEGQQPREVLTYRRNGTKRSGKTRRLERL